MEQVLARRERTASLRQRRADFSPVRSDRVRALARRAIEGAPALTQGEIREMAQAIIDHNNDAFDG